MKLKKDEEPNDLSWKTKFKSIKQSSLGKGKSVDSDSKNRDECKENKVSNVLIRCQVLMIDTQNNEKYNFKNSSFGQFSMVSCRYGIFVKLCSIWYHFFVQFKKQP